MTTQVFAYVRVSGPTQSVERQRNDLRDDCEDHDLEVIREFTDEGIGASILTTKVRNDYEALVALIGSGQIDNSVVWLSEISRITRNGEQYGELRRLCRKHRVKFWVSSHKRLVDVARNTTDIEFMNGEVAKAEAEVLTLSRRVRSGVRQAVKEKRPHGRIPYGYRREYDSVTGELAGQVPHPIHAPILREIASRYAAGESSIAISRDLNDRGILAPHDAGKVERDPSHVPTGKWHDCDIASRATNPVYTGQRHYSGTQPKLHGLHEGSWPALIDDETFARCAERKRIANSHHYVPKPGRHLVTGIAKCGGRCGGVGYIGTRTKYGRSTYCCLKGCMQLDEAAVDAMVSTKVVQVLESDGWRRLMVVDPGMHNAATARLAAADKAHAELLLLADKRQITVAGFIALEKGLLDDIEAARAELARLSVPTVLHTLMHKTKSAAMVYAELPLAVKRKIIATLVDEGELSITLIPIGRGRGREFGPQHVSFGQ